MSDRNTEGDCCALAHANATPPWTCHCECHDKPHPRLALAMEEIDSVTEDELEIVFPLTADECHLLYSELRTHTFSRHHPMFHYNSSLLDRMRRFIEVNEDKLNLAKDIKF